ncbi:ALK EXO [Epiphyas postvittana nucleopolyhedrovirus]|uniref:ALK EXO n=1 Tax=Epiphyas postvittana nucleopolyhedrovirus TaxID=70600 RepID=Q91GD7_NPVEP|nr:ALK EXO [Epiphyas postvittana nucleopolyhedrovirus]AAK85682.1 ALK EXO [Epiphyas postvittana nucleopolyhedrovirus]
MHAFLTTEQRLVYDKYKLAAYARSINLTRKQLDQWRDSKIIVPDPVSREETLRVEAATRGQSKNDLWFCLRSDRSTASRSSNSTGSNGIGRAALAFAFGNAQEDVVKTTNAELFVQLESLAEQRVGCAVIKTVLNCGMFLSAFGLNSASPDAYFAMADGTWVPVEIKCPLNYRDTTVDQMRLELGNANRKYRVKHTALLVNKMGPPEFEVVKTHDHYRQMQRQMYVLRNAPVCFYIVRFKNNLVSVSVPRDENFCRKEANTEAAAFVSFALANANRAQFKRADNRRASFNATDHCYDAAQVNALVLRGLYLSYGQLKCAYCEDFTLDSKATFEMAVTRTHISCDFASLQMDEFDNKAFFDFAKRYATLINQYENARALAHFGYYAGADGLKTFCCGVRGTVESQHHVSTCSYYIGIIKKMQM